MHQDEASCPEHVFSDMWNFLSAGVRQKLSQIQKDDVDKKRELIMQNPTVNIAQCCKCGKQCVAKRADLHCGGTPCIHDSSFGKGERLKGKEAWILLTFCRQRLDMREPRFIAENVAEQGDVEYRRNLSELYDLERVVICPTSLGWKSRRKRQFILGTLRYLNIRVPRLLVPSVQ